MLLNIHATLAVIRLSFHFSFSTLPHSLNHMPSVFLPEPPTTIPDLTWEGRQQNKRLQRDPNAASGREEAHFSSYTSNSVYPLHFGLSLTQFAKFIAFTSTWCSSVVSYTEISVFQAWLRTFKDHWSAHVRPSLPLKGSAFFLRTLLMRFLRFAQWKSITSLYRIHRFHFLMEKGCSLLRTNWI